MPNFVDIFKAAFLGIIEGLTEFIPISSTAHLIIFSHLVEFQSIKNNLFEIVIQFGAILAICVIYRKKILSIALNLKQKNQQKFLLNLIIAFLPAALIGSLFHDLIKKFLFSNLVIAISLIFGGVVMILVDYPKKNSSSKIPEKKSIEDIENITPISAFKIGLFQCLAMIPGISRSGATIIGGLLLGLNRKVATEFSFFLAIPVIAAASFYDVFKNTSELTNSNIQIILVGLFAAFFSSILVIKWFINFVSNNSFIPFGIYRITLGFVILFLIL